MLRGRSGEVVGVEEEAVQVVGAEDEDEEVLLEPRFKYERIEGRHALELLESQIATAIAVHDKFVALGTQTGWICLMDHLGNVDRENLPMFRPHRSAVTQLAFEDSGSYLISCANDGKVIISGIGTNDLGHVATLKVLPRSVAIFPSFARSGATPTFVVGERNLIVYEKKFFKYKEMTIYRGVEKDGFISRCSWRGIFIAFTNDTGTRVYDRSLEKLITLIAPSHDVDRIRSSKCPPDHCWLDDVTLAIAWADTLIVSVIVTIHEGIMPTRRGEIHFSWKLPGILCSGVSSRLDPKGKWNEIVVFGLRPDVADDLDSSFCDAASMVSLDSIGGRRGAPHVQVVVVAPLSFNDYRLMAEDRLGIESKPSSLPCQFHMAGLPSCDSYFLLSTSNLVVVVFEMRGTRLLPVAFEMRSTRLLSKINWMLSYNLYSNRMVLNSYCSGFKQASTYGTIDSVQWRAENGLWEEAWDLAKEKSGDLEATDWDARIVGRRMVEHLLETQKPRLALAKLKEVCGDQRTEWEWAVELFERSSLATLLAEDHVLPTNNPTLEPECYETVLTAALYNDVRLFKRLVQHWSPDLYRTASMSGMTLRRIQDAVTKNASQGLTLSNEEEVFLYQALAHLYVYERKFDSAIKIYLSLREQQIFSVIDKFQLFELVKDQISELMSINTDLALRLLLDNEDSVPASLVMTKISRQPKLQIAYLERLFGKNEGIEFVDLAVRLYAEHDRKRLLQFLRKNEYYNINRALQICKEKEYNEEMILLLGKSGDHLNALNLMVQKFNQLDKAIEYCKEHDDNDLWEHLITLVLRTPEHIAQLLVQAGSSIDPINVIRKIPESQDIPGLRLSLSKVLSDCAARVDLLGGCREATFADSRDLLARFLAQSQCVAGVSTRTRCSVCSSTLLSTWDTSENGMRVFGCGHVAHTVCSIESERKMMLGPGTCSACSESTRDEAVM